MTLEEQFKKETKPEEFDKDYLNSKYYLKEYIEWLEAKINYTRCCNKLKGKEPITFIEWMKLKDMRELMTNFYWDGINLKVYTTSELMRVYIKTTL